MNVIETRDLCKQYGAALRVAHLNLNVPEGSVYGFLGPNGAGKSTTLKMLLGPVSYTHLDVYKRQVQLRRQHLLLHLRAMRQPYLSGRGGKRGEQPLPAAGALRPVDL